VARPPVTGREVRRFRDGAVGMLIASQSPSGPPPAVAIDLGENVMNKTTVVVNESKRWLDLLVALLLPLAMFAILLAGLAPSLARAESWQDQIVTLSQGIASGDAVFAGEP